LNKWLEDIGTGVFASDAQSNTPEWHAERAKGIGGSELGAILGLNPYESAYSLWHKKMGLVEDKIEPNWSIRFGNAFERPILELFAEEHPELDIYETGSFFHKEHTWMRANPDALARDRDTGEWQIIEVKTARAGWDEIPKHYISQVQWYMSVMGITKATIVAVAGWNYLEQEIEFDPFVDSVNFTAAQRFYNSLTSGEKPDWDGSRSTYETVRLLHPDISDESVEVPQELASGLIESNNRFLLAQTELNKMKSQVYDAMGKAKQATSSGEVFATRQARGFGKPYLVIRK